MTETLSTLFDELNALDVKYFLLTDFECDLFSKDIDLFVHPDSKRLFEDTLLKQGWFKRKEPSYHVNHHFYYSPNLDFYLDIKYALSFAQGENDCFEYLPMEEAVANSYINKVGIRRPQAQDAILLYAAHLAFKERGKLEDKHKKYLAEYINDFQLMNNSMPAVVTKIAKWLKTSFPRHTNELQKILQPFFSHSYQKMTNDIKYSRHGMGLKVLFLGTDGAGKSTLIEAVREKMNMKVHKLYLGVGEQGWVSSFLWKLYCFKPNVRFVRRLFTLLNTFIILPIELLLRIVPIVIKSKYSVVLIDRVPGTIFLNKSVKKFVYESILPKPDIVFFIHADPNVIVQRKPSETTIERSTADIKKFEKVADIISGGNYISIDTTNISIVEARDIILSKIYKNSKVYNKLLTTSFN